MGFSEVEDIVDHLTMEKIIPAISIAIGIDGEIVFQKSSGIISESNIKITHETQFDVASLTKIFSGICFMQMIQEGTFELDDPICAVFPEMGRERMIEKDGIVIDSFPGEEITWRHVLTHTSGMGWVRPKTRPSLPGLDSELQVIYDLPFKCRPNTHIIYSDIGIILMGKAMEKAELKPLDSIIEERLLKPLGLNNTCFRRRSTIDSNNDSQKVKIPPTEYDDQYRMKRVWGEVHDENAYQLDGVAAHAGVFSSAVDVCRIMMEFSSARKAGGILSSYTAKEMSSLQVEEDGDRRGLIWQLSGRGPNAYTRFLSANAYGHAGFTGTFAWSDPDNDLSIVFLSNDVYNGRERRQLAKYRPVIMEAVHRGLGYENI